MTFQAPLSLKIKLSSVTKGIKQYRCRRQCKIINRWMKVLGC